MNFKSLIKKFPSVWGVYWNKKFGGTGVLKYKAETGKEAVDVRTLLKDSIEVQKWTENNIIHSWDDDKKALECLRLVMNNIAYVSDSKKYGKPERWQTPLETFHLGTGDCEDGALLMMKLMQYAGIPDWRRKICCGWVNTPQGRTGHAYVIYLADDFQWFVLDWCYWAMSSIEAFKKKPQNKRKEYGDIWWTFNETYCWANQHDTIIRWKE